MMESMYYVLFMVEMLIFILICYFMFAEESTTKQQHPNLANEHLGNYRMAIPLIGINFIFLVLSAYGGYSIDYYVLENITTTPVYEINSAPITDYNIWIVVFFMLFLIHVLFMFKNVFDYLREATFDDDRSRSRR